MQLLPDKSEKAGNERIADVQVNQASGSMALGIVGPLRAPAKGMASIGPQIQAALKGMKEGSLMSSMVCDVLILHSLWRWLVTIKERDRRQQEQPEQQNHRNAQQSLSGALRQHCSAQWCQLDGKTKRSGLLVCALAAAAILVTCKSKSGHQRAERAARATIVRRKTIRQRSQGAGIRGPMPLSLLTDGPSEATTTRIGSIQTDSSLDDEQWWFEATASGKEAQQSQVAGEGSFTRRVSGSHGDATQPERKQQLRQQQHPSVATSSSQSSPSAPRIRNLLSPKDVVNTPRANSSLPGTPISGSSLTSTPRIRNLLSSEMLEDSSLLGTKQRGSARNHRHGDVI